MSKRNFEHRYLRVKDAAKYLGVGTDTVYTWVRHDALTSIRVGGLRLIDMWSIADGNGSKAGYLTIRGCEAYLGVPADTVRTWARKGVVESIKVGRLRLISRDGLDALAEETGDGRVGPDDQGEVAAGGEASGE